MKHSSLKKRCRCRKLVLEKNEVEKRVKELVKKYFKDKK